MANRDATLFSQQSPEAARQYRPSLAPLQQQLVYCQMDYTIPAGVTLADGDKIRFGYPNIRNGVLRPELSRITVVGSTDVDLNLTLKGVAVDAAGTATETAISASTAIDNNSVAVGRITSRDTPAIGAADYIMGLIDTYEAGTATRVIRLELVFASVENRN